MSESQFKPVTLETKHVALKLLPYGLTFHSLVVRDASDDAGRELLVGPSEPSDHHFSHGRKFQNQTIGRYANRLPVGRTEKDGIVLDLEGDGACLHGGPEGFDLKEWSKLTRDRSSLFPEDDFLYPPPSNSEAKESIFALESPAGESGFPSQLHTEALVIVSEPEDGSDSDRVGTVRYILRSKMTEENASKTPVNLTVHWGFNLNPEGKAEGRIDTHRLWLNSWNIVEVDEKQLPTGKLLCSLPGKPAEAFDFHRGTREDSVTHRRLGDNPPASGIDHNFILNGVPPTHAQAVLTSPDGKVSLQFSTNQSSVQFFAPDQAVFLEFHHPLATFLHPELARTAGTDTFLRAGEVYENVVQLDLVMKE